jgi:hypothetical protein
MKWNDHSRYEGQHALFPASRPSWLNYGEDQLLTYCDAVAAKERGTILHKFAQDCIELGQWLPKKPETTLSLYVNDAISFNMRPEQVLFYSKYFFGTADAIDFTGGALLRIHDLKTGTIPGKMDQLLIYDALFCLEYDIPPEEIGHSLRIYQFDTFVEHEPLAEEIHSVMDQIQLFNELLLLREEEDNE